MCNPLVRWSLRLGVAAFALAAMPPLGASEGTVLEEIIVTAERREADLQDVPISVAVLSGERLAELNISDPQALADFTPNLSIGDGTGRSAGGMMVSIRGVNEARVSPALDPAVGIYIDDIYYGRPQTAFLKLLDVERVEVLRGGAPKAPCSARTAPAAPFATSPRSPASTQRAATPWQLWAVSSAGMRGSP